MQAPEAFCQGWCSLVSMLITGTEPCAASASTVSWEAVRIAIAWTKRDSTSAVSRGDSPRDSCISPSRSTTG